MKNKLVALAALGGLTLVGCDNSGEVELAQREYNGKVTIRLVQEVKFAEYDSYKLEVRDSTGAMLGRLRSYQVDDGQIYLSPGKVYDFDEKGIRLSDSK